MAELLRFMLDAAEGIEMYLSDVEKKDFLGETAQGRMRREAVVYNLGVLGEVANDICQHYPETVRRHPDIPFSRIYAMRNHIFHGYHSINYDVVWTTCKADLPDVTRSLRALVDKVEGAKGT
ncbi:HepT-like ribonuclease domain-containing protein [uncultured Rhodospira sp.]|uniref:HepT-like ribonuclease domain-containing protein n=1 Tax=uncultured Rhodospira sp. TaxID=1936189 RepID=UPI00260EA0FD|nr:HepT-like ribonuclease domain-containing protein [uncultured Rhodospira sp.]